MKSQKYVIICISLTKGIVPLYLFYVVKNVKIQKKKISKRSRLTVLARRKQVYVTYYINLRITRFTSVKRKRDQVSFF